MDETMLITFMLLIWFVLSTFVLNEDINTDRCYTVVAKGNKTVQFDTIHKQFSDKHVL